MTSFIDAEERRERMPLRQSQGQLSYPHNSGAPIASQGFQSNSNDSSSDAHLVQARRVLPISLLASLGMTATVATTIYAYAELLCADPTACEEAEQARFGGLVAVANGVAHAVTIAALGPLEHLARRNFKIGLGLWIVFRASSVFILVFGVSVRSIVIAVLARIFEGLASDNLLHFSLNTIYASVKPYVSGSEVSRMIGTSLALYMVGTTLGPFSVALFNNYLYAFGTALLIFSIAFAYLIIFIPQPAETAHSVRVESSSLPVCGSKFVGVKESCKLGVLIFFSPMRLFYENSRAIPHGLSLLLYTSVQAHLFPALMVFGTVRFNFSSFENGMMVSLAASCAAAQLLFTLRIWPLITAFLTRREWWIQTELGLDHHNRTDRNATILALLVQMVALSVISRCSQIWQLYLAVSFVAVGLTVPSYLKGHFVSVMPDGAQAISTLAMTEGVGGFLSAILLGTWQTVYPGDSVFLFAVVLLSLSLGLFIVGAALNRF